MRRSLHLRNLPPKPLHQPHEKNIRQIQSEGHSTKYNISTPQICQGHERQGKTEKLSQTTEGYGGMPLNAVWYPELDPRTEKGYK